MDVGDKVKLEPCPFCRGSAHIQTEFRAGRVIECGECGAAVGAQDLARGIEMWNRRTPSASIGEDGLPDAARGVRTWRERMPAPWIEYMCSMNCSGKRPCPERSCGDCMPVTVHGDAVAARDAEIAELRTRLASERQAKEYEQRHAAESETALAVAHEDAARWRFMAAVMNDEDGAEARALRRAVQELPKDDRCPEPEQFAEAVDKARAAVMRGGAHWTN